MEPGAITRIREGLPSARKKMLLGALQLLLALLLGVWATWLASGDSLLMLIPFLLVGQLILLITGITWIKRGLVMRHKVVRIDRGYAGWIAKKKERAQGQLSPPQARGELSTLEDP